MSTYFYVVVKGWFVEGPRKAVLGPYASLEQAADIALCHVEGLLGSLVGGIPEDLLITVDEMTPDETGWVYLTTKMEITKDE